MNVKKNVIEKIENMIYEVSLFLLLWSTGIVVTTSLFFLFGISICKFNVILPFILCCFYFVYEKGINRYSIGIITISFTIIVLCILFSGYNYDQTWDGAAYHKQAVGLLKEGWNPIYMNDRYYNSLSGSIPEEIAQKATNPLVWAEYYPKASWYFAGSIYYLTNNIESGKAYTLIFMIILFGLSYHCLKEELVYVWKSVAGAGAIALNPIALAQIQSFYIDGLSGCILLALMMELLSIIGNKDIESDKKLLISCLIIWGCNLKFSILAFTGFICIVYYLHFVKLHWKEWSIVIKEFIYYFVMAVTSICIVGYAPYVTNIVRYKNPLAGFSDLAFDDASINANFGIDDINTFQRSLYSLFGKMSHGSYHSVGELLKIPFTYDKEELYFYRIVDLRVGAFGILFSGIFCVSIIVLIILGLKRRRANSTKVELAILFAILTFLELFAFRPSYQMRYVPHIYFIPVIAFLFLLKNVGLKKEKSIVNCVTIFLTIAILINIFPWIKLVAIRQQEGIKTRAELQCLAENIESSDNLTIAFWAYDFSGMHYNLKDNGIANYEFVDISELEGDIKTTYGNWIQYHY